MGVGFYEYRSPTVARELDPLRGEDRTDSGGSAGLDLIANREMWRVNRNSVTNANLVGAALRRDT